MITSAEGQLAKSKSTIKLFRLLQEFHASNKNPVDVVRSLSLAPVMLDGKKYSDWEEWRLLGHVGFVFSLHVLVHRGEGESVNMQY